jgi:hypothetical protein
MHIDEPEKETPITDSKQLHSLQVHARNLHYDRAGVQTGYPLFKTEAADFPLDPDPRFLRQLNRLKSTDGPLLRLLKLLAVTGSNRHLLMLILRGIRTGLSHGTMDVIYRLNTGNKSSKVLDNLDIAVGALQRRVIVADLIAKRIRELCAQTVISLAGGSCLLAIEGIYQSGHPQLTLVNYDHSPAAHDKARKILAQAENDIDVRFRPVTTDVLNSAWRLDGNGSSPQVVECTGFWEYLVDAERTWLLKKLAVELRRQDVLLLTFLRHNPQQEIFEAMKFKQLYPHPLETMLPQVEQHFDVERIVLTPNETYVTLELTKGN